MASFSSFSEVLAKVREVVVDQFCLDSLEDLDNNAQFIRDLGADSLDVVQLVMVLEEQFEILLENVDFFELIYFQDEHRSVQTRV